MGLGRRGEGCAFGKHSNIRKSNPPLDLKRKSVQSVSPASSNTRFRNSVPSQKTSKRERHEALTKRNEEKNVGETLSNQASWIREDKG